MRSYRNGQTDRCSALRGGNGSHYSGCRFHVLQKPILGTADSEYWHCLSVRSFLLEIPHASMIAMDRPRLSNKEGRCPLLGAKRTWCGASGATVSRLSRLALCSVPLLRSLIALRFDF